MLRKLVYLLLIAAGVSFIHYGRKLVSNYGPYTLDRINSNQPWLQEIGSMQLTLQNLEELTSIPIIGQFFLERKLKVLIREKNWQKVLSECAESGVLLMREAALKLLIYRAIAECATYQFLKCESTIRELDMRAPHLGGKLSYLMRKERGKNEGSPIMNMAGSFDYQL